MAAQGTRAKQISRALVIVVALATTMAGTVTPAMAAQAGQASIALSGVWDWLTGNPSTPAPRLPVQQTGTARGLPHQVPASATEAHRDTGYPRGRGRGQLPPFKRHGPDRHTFKTRTYIGNGAHSFNLATSRPVWSRATATSTLYRNADGSYTRLVYPGPVISGRRTARGSRSGPR